MTLISEYTRRAPRGHRAAGLQTAPIPVIRGYDSASRAEATLARIVAAWVERENIAPAHLASAVAGSLVIAGGLDWTAWHFGLGTPSETLRLTAVSLAVDADLTLEEWAAENRPHYTADVRQARRPA